MITTGLEKPDKASAGDNMPNIINANRVGTHLAHSEKHSCNKKNDNCRDHNEIIY